MKSLVRQAANIHTVEWDYNQLAVVATLNVAEVCFHPICMPRAGSEVVRMDPLHFLAGYRTRRLNQA